MPLSVHANDGFSTEVTTDDSGRTQIAYKPQPPGQYDSLIKYVCLYASPKVSKATELSGSTCFEVFTNKLDISSESKQLSSEKVQLGWLV